MQATLNIRIDQTLKVRGDKVLRAHGVSTSAAVRALWEHLAATKELPDFLHEAHRDEKACEKKKAALKALAGIGEGPYSNLTDEELNAIYLSRYE